MNKIILLGCVATKGTASAPAKDLYQSPLFRARCRYAAASKLPWAILSAKHGTLHPDAILAPYDQRIPTNQAASKVWAEEAMRSLKRILHNWNITASAQNPLILEIHAGISYVDPLRGFIRRCRIAAEKSHLAFCEVTHPVKGLGIGEQLRFYARFAKNTSNPTCPD